MKKEYVEEVLKALERAGVIFDYEDIGLNIFSIDDDSYYIALNKENQLEDNPYKIQDRVNILKAEKELEESKKVFKEEYQEDYK